MKKVLVVSLGSIGKRHLKNTRELLPDCEIGIFRQHHAADKSVPDGANKVFFDLPSALAFKPDAVIIASPASDHTRNAIDFIENGAHLFIEKPLAVTANGIETMLSVCKKSSKFAMVGYVLRFQPIVKFLKDFIASGELGEVRTANVEVGQYLPDWRPGGDYRTGVSAQKDLGGGVLLELSHELDYSTWLFGKPDSIFCSSDRVSDLDINVEDSACVIMEYNKSKQKKRVVVHLDFLQRVANMAVQVVGSQATLYADLIKETAHLVIPGNETPRELVVPKLVKGNDMYLRQFDFFFSKCFSDYKLKFNDLKNYDGWVSVEDAATVLRLVDTARLSNEKGQRMPFMGINNAK